MKYKQFKLLPTDLDGPFKFIYYQDKNKKERPCYIISGFQSGITIVICPEIKIGGETIAEEIDLAKETNGEFKSYGRDNYFNG
jgi:hypothetical protein